MVPSCEVLGLLCEWPLPAKSWRYVSLYHLYKIYTCFPKEGGWPEKTSFWSMGYTFLKPNRSSWALEAFSQESLAVRLGATVTWRKQIYLELMPMPPSSPTAVQYLAYSLSQQMQLDSKGRVEMWPLPFLILAPALCSIPWKRVVKMMLKKWAQARLGRNMEFILFLFSISQLKW